MARGYVACQTKLLSVLIRRRYGADSFDNVPGKRVAQASESRTPPTLRTSPISIHNASTQRYATDALENLHDAIASLTRGSLLYARRK
jgi:hypothetical protein